MAEISDQQLAELQELLAKSRQGSGAEQTQTVVQPQAGMTLKLGGQSYSVRDQDEAQRLLDQYEAQRSQEQESQRVQLESERQRQEELSRQQQRLPQGSNADGFDKEEYARLFLNDPRKAQKYLLAHDPEQIQFYSGLVSQLQAVKQEQAASQFLLQHRDDYTPTKENYKALEGLISQFNLPWDINGMNLAFSVGKAQGLITDPEQSSSKGGRQQESAPEEESFVAAPRISRRRSQQQSSDESVLSQFENLSPDKQKAWLESLTVNQQ